MDLHRQQRLVDSTCLWSMRMHNQGPRASQWLQPLPVDPTILFFRREPQGSLWLSWKHVETQNQQSVVWKDSLLAGWRRECAERTLSLADGSLSRYQYGFHKNWAGLQMCGYVDLCTNCDNGGTLHLWNDSSSTEGLCGTSRLLAIPTKFCALCKLLIRLMFRKWK